MFARENRTCPIWPGFEAEVVADDPLKRLSVVVNSPRAGGCYRIIRQAEGILNREVNPFDDYIRARLTTILINARASGEEWPLVNQGLIEQAEQAGNLKNDERADRLLRYMRTTINGDLLPVPLHEPDVVHSAFAHSESTTLEELSQLLKFLVSQGWIELPSPNSNSYQPVITVAGNRRIRALAGHARIAELSTRTDSAQAFVAMWFDVSTKKVYKCAIKPAIEDAGYDPVRIDEVHFTNPIIEEIKAQIRRSCFVVADVTHGDDGARGGVYLEVGLSLDQNIPVIFTAERGTEPHSDISPYPRLEWERDNLPAFRSALTERIMKLEDVGPGPGLD